MFSLQQFCFEACTIVYDANTVTFKSLKCFALHFWKDLLLQERFGSVLINATTHIISQKCLDSARNSEINLNCLPNVFWLDMSKKKDLNPLLKISGCPENTSVLWQWSKWGSSNFKIKTKPHSFPYIRPVVSKLI